MTDRTARSATSPVQKAQHLTRRSLLAATIASAVAPAWTFAQGADRPLRLVLPVSAGSGVDGVARVLGPSLGKALARPVVVENYPGAGGITGTTMIVKAPKDGSMLGMVSNNHAVNPSVFKNIPYHAVDDITPITLIGATPFVLVAHPSVAAKNVRELVALAKAQPGVLNYGSSGNGTILHLAAEMFVHEAQVDIKHIPYRGMGPLTADVLGGQIQMAFIAVAVAAPHVKAGALRAIGLSSTTRSPLLPDLATIAEQGLPNYALDGWMAGWPWWARPVCPGPKWTGPTMPCAAPWRHPKCAMPCWPRATSCKAPLRMPRRRSSAARSIAWRSWSNSPG